MAQEQRYKRDQDGLRFDIGGMNTVLPPDAMSPGKYPYLENVRRYLQGRVTGRATLTAATETLAGPVNSLRRLNDTTPLGPGSGFALIAGAAGNLYCNSTIVDSGLSNNPMSLVPFRPSASVQPWMYVADANKMDKVNANATKFFMGVKEPQDAPAVASQQAVVSGTVVVPSSTRPWNPTGTNPVNYPFTSTGGTNPVVIACAAGATIQLNVLVPTQTIVTSYGTVAAGALGPVAAGSPGANVPGAICNVLMGAFVDGSGNVLTPATGQGPWTVGTGPTTLLAPFGAVSFQLGIDDTTYVSGGGGNQFDVAYSVTTQAVTNVVSILGAVTAYFWGDSPNSGPVASYIWNNPSDPTATAHPRTVSTAAGKSMGTSLTFDYFVGGGNPGQPMEWTALDSSGNITAQVPVFATPPAPTTTFADFNMCIVGTLYVPAAGDYTFTLNSKDGCIWGIGGAATWAGKGTLRGYANQSITVVNKTELLPNVPLFGGAEAEPNAVTVTVTFPAPGDYPIELDYDYWFHTPRGLWLTCAQNTGIVNNFLPPLSATLLTNTQYRYTYRSSATGATSNPSPESDVNNSPVQASTITPLFSTDPQVDKVDYYRIDSAIDNFTYVGTGPNTNPPTPFVDELLDASIANNPLLQFNNYQPFPVIDQPHKGVVNVTAGVATWVSGDHFNVRWLAGTIINSGGIAYTLNTRPTSTTTLTATGIEDGTNLTYEIDEPLLAAQPMPAMWGPTDNAAYMFACGDTINPGTLYWTNGNNPDGAGDTNQQNVTSPSEPLQNGCIVNGIGMVFSSERAWLIYPNFTNAAATVAGVVGSPWQLIESITERGLYIRTAIAVDGGKTVAFRAKDGIFISPGGTGSQSITDADLYNLFPHEGVVPQPIIRDGHTIHPPDDSRPNAQQLHFANGYLFYDYQDASGINRTLVFDMAAKGWIIDTYQVAATIHVLEEGPAVNGVLVGCTDGTVRTLSGTGTETATCVVLTPAVNGGDARADKTVGDVFVRASVVTSPVSVTAYSNQFATTLTGSTPATLAPGAGLQPYIIDFSNGLARDVADVELGLTWAAGTATYIDLWQPDWTDLPEVTQDRPTDWTDSGAAGAMFWQGLILEADTFNQPKAIRVQSSDDLQFHVPDQSPVTFNGQSKQALTFTPPFVAHSVRIVTTDGVPWRYFGAQWVGVPFPEATVEWQSEKVSLGNVGWQHIREINLAYISTAAVTVTLTFDTGAVPSTIVLSFPSTAGAQAKTKMPVPVNKFKLVDFRVSSTSPVTVFKEDIEVKVGQWGRSSAYRIVKPFGGDTAEGANL